MVRVPPDHAGKQRIDVRFTYDVNGLLEVETTIASSGAKQRTVIAQNPGVLSPEQIEERFAALALLKLHPREDLVNRQVLARAERIYSESLGSSREAISARLAQFRGILEQQDPRRIAQARGEFAAFLDHLEQAY